MVRRIRLAVYVLVASLALASAACSDATAPRAEDPPPFCDKTNGNTC
jgi:hypothetical protein